MTNAYDVSACMVHIAYLMIRSAWTAPSGQPDGPSFGAALRGKPEPMGATLVDEQVSQSFSGHGR